MRFFNTAGPVDPEMYYCVPPLERLEVDEFLLLIRQRKYLILHAPRQTGKTSALLALRDALNTADEFRCAYVNVEGGQSAREDVGEAMRAILSALARSARETLDDQFVAGVWPDILETAGPHDALRETLARWSESSPQPLVLMIDEVDALVGDTLIAVLRQLRSGYPEGPGRFPQSGVRDVRGYRIQSSEEKATIAGGSAFNVRAESLRLGDFSPENVATVLAQHTAETGQRFSTGARVVADAWEASKDAGSSEPSESGHRMQGATPGTGQHRPRRPRPDVGLHGPVRHRRRAPSGLRPNRRQAMERQALPARPEARRRTDYGVGDVVRHRGKQRSSRPRGHELCEALAGAFRTPVLSSPFPRVQGIAYR